VVEVKSLPFGSPGSAAAARRFSRGFRIVAGFADRLGIGLIVGASFGERDQVITDGRHGRAAGFSTWLA